MKTLITFFAFVAIFMSNVCAQSQRQIVKTLDLKGQTLVASFHGDIKVVETETEFVRITATIDVANFSDDILKKLIEVGRYDIKTTVGTDGKTILSMPSIEKRVVIKGVDLVERMSYEISVPKGTEISIEKLDMPISNQVNPASL
jgi:hypothetical protein